MAFRKTSIAMKALQLTSLILLELNEINFDFVEKYIAGGRLPNFSRLLQRHGICNTASEQEYEHLEPWIQWVTAHTGLCFADHKVFRLGDIVGTDIEQIWEFLEGQGLKVGAICPMNANNRTQHASFFLPDPWTSTPVTGSKLLQRLSESISQAVNDNASAKLNLTSIAWLILSIMIFVPLNAYSRYLSMLMSALKGQAWAKAQLLDELLSDVTVKQMKQHRPDFTTLFLNAGAHIQHHYMFNASVYDGKQSNPNWLLDPNADPIFDIYDQYDKIVGKLQSSFPNHRLMIATGLHQDPFPYQKYYWRLANHKKFLDLIGVEFESVEPRMSRDFLIVFRSKEHASRAEQRLITAKAHDGQSLFEVDNRGESLFVALVFPDEITETTEVHLGNVTIGNFRQHVAFVAVKNGEHNGVGYFIDTGVTPENVEQNIPLWSLPDKVASNFGLSWRQRGILQRTLGTV